jgi:hypothetical protein
MNKKKEVKEFILHTSLYIKNEGQRKEMVEQIYKDGKSQFCIYDANNDEISYANEIYSDKGIKIEPIQDEEVEKKAVLLPSDAIDYGSDDELDKAIKSFIYKWVDIDKETTMFAVLNIKRSWIYDKFNTLNYLRAMGDLGQGKSRFLMTLGSIHYKPLFCNGAMTAAPFFRMIEKWKGSQTIDEADFGKSDETVDIIKAINIGYEKGSFIMRCDQNDASKIKLFSPFSPKVIATRKPFEDKATESRCITTIMKGTSRMDIPSTLNEDFYKEAEELRNKLLMWRFKNYFKIDPDKKFDIDMTELEPRIKQIISSFACLIPKSQEDQFKAYITEKQEDIVEERKNSFAGLVVEGIYKLYTAGELYISNEDIIEAQNMTDKYNKPYKARALTNTLRELGFGKNKSVRVGSKTKRCIPMDEEHLKYLFKRYNSVNDVTVVTIVTETELNRTKEVFGEKKEEKDEIDLGQGVTVSTVTTVTCETEKEEKNEL